MKNRILDTLSKSSEFHVSTLFNVVKRFQDKWDKIIKCGNNITIFKSLFEMELRDKATNEMKLILEAGREELSSNSLQIRDKLQRKMEANIPVCKDEFEKTLELDYTKVKKDAESQLQQRIRDNEHLKHIGRFFESLETQLYSSLQYLKEEVVDEWRKIYSSYKRKNQRLKEYSKLNENISSKTPEEIKKEQEEKKGNLFKRLVSSLEKIKMNFDWHINKVRAAFDYYLSSADGVEFTLAKTIVTPSLKDILLIKPFESSISSLKMSFLELEYVKNQDDSFILALLHSIFNEQLSSCLNIQNYLSTITAHINKVKEFFPSIKADYWNYCLKIIYISIFIIERFEIFEKQIRLGEFAHDEIQKFSIKKNFDSLWQCIFSKIFAQLRSIPELKDANKKDFQKKITEFKKIEKAEIKKFEDKYKKFEDKYKKLVTWTYFWTKPFKILYHKYCIFIKLNRQNRLTSPGIVNNLWSHILKHKEPNYINDLVLTLVGNFSEKLIMKEFQEIFDEYMTNLKQINADLPFFIDLAQSVGNESKRASLIATKIFEVLISSFCKNKCAILQGTIIDDIKKDYPTPKELNEQAYRISFEQENYENVLKYVLDINLFIQEIFTAAHESKLKNLLLTEMDNMIGEFLTIVSQVREQITNWKGSICEYKTLFLAHYISGRIAHKFEKNDSRELKIVTINEILVKLKSNSNLDPNLAQYISANKMNAQLAEFKTFFQNLKVWLQSAQDKNLDELINYCIDHYTEAKTKFKVNSNYFIACVLEAIEIFYPQIEKDDLCEVSYVTLKDMFQFKLKPSEINWIPSLAECKKIAKRRFSEEKIIKNEKFIELYSFLISPGFELYDIRVVNFVDNIFSGSDEDLKKECLQECFVSQLIIQEFKSIYISIEKKLIEKDVQPVNPLEESKTSQEEISKGPFTQNKEKRMIEEVLKSYKTIFYSKFYDEIIKPVIKDEPYQNNLDLYGLKVEKNKQLYQFLLQKHNQIIEKIAQIKNGKGQGEQNIESDLSRFSVLDQVLRSISLFESTSLTYHLQVNLPQFAHLFQDISEIFSFIRFIQQPKHFNDAFQKQLDDSKVTSKDQIQKNFNSTLIKLLTNYVESRKTQIIGCQAFCPTCHNKCTHPLTTPHQHTTNIHYLSGLSGIGIKDHNQIRYSNLNKCCTRSQFLIGWTLGDAKYKNLMDMINTAYPEWKEEFELNQIAQITEDPSEIEKRSWMATRIILLKHHNYKDNTPIEWEDIQPKPIQIRLSQIKEYTKVSDEGFFTELKSIAEGGFGSVKKVKSNIDGRIYALKIPLFHKDTLEKEMKITMKLNHPNIVLYYDYFIDIKERICILMKFEEGIY